MPQGWPNKTAKYWENFHRFNELGVLLNPKNARTSTNLYGEATKRVQKKFPRKGAKALSAAAFAGIS
jgi:hypothetical protein